MTADPVIKINVQSDDFDISIEIDDLCEGIEDVGAVVSFAGKCRSESGRLAALELEHYPGMAESTIRNIAQKACDNWDVKALKVIHRHGMIKPGENIVLVIAVSSHRAASFSAADFLMDFLKTDAPFWKKEHSIDSETVNEWVSAKEQDEQVKNRWQNLDS